MANQIQLVMYEGYLGADPEMRLTADSAKPVTTFRMASNRTYNNAAKEKVEETTWIRVTTWGKLAEVVDKWCKKGSHVLIQGILHPGKNGSPTVYELKDGGHGSSYEVTAEKVRIFRASGDSVEASEQEIEDLGY